MAAQVAVTLGVGGALYLAPSDTADIWPWTLTPLTARAVGAGLLGLSVASAWGLRERDWARIGGPAISFAAYGALELIALLRFHATVAWDDWQTWALVALLASFLALGVESVRARLPASLPARAAAG
jgi:hypothetical protein